MSRRLRLGMLTVFAAACAVAFTILVLYTFSRPGLRQRWDLSTAKNHGLSTRTKEALLQLPEGSRLTAFLFREDPSLQWFGSTVYDQAFQILRSLVDDAGIRSGGRLQTLILDQQSALVAREREIHRLDRQPGETIILEVGEQKKVLAFDDLFQIARPSRDGTPARLRKQRIEAALGDAAIALAAGKAPTAAVIVGYGQGRLDDSKGLAPFAEFLQRENWNLQAVDGPGQAANADLLIIPGQPRPFLPHDAEAMHQWLQAGKPLLLSLDPNAPPSVVDFWNQELEERGTGFASGLVCEPIKVMGELLTGRSDNAQLEIASEQLSPQHPITLPLIEAQRYLLFAGVRPVLFAAGTNDYTQDRLIRSKPLAWVDQPGGQLFFQDDGEALGIVPLAVAAERWSPNAEGQWGRVVVLGCAESMRSGLVYNREFLARCLLWLHGEASEDRGLLGLGEMPFRPERAVMARLHNISIFGIPGVTFLVAFWIFWRRRR